MANSSMPPFAVFESPSNSPSASTERDDDHHFRASSDYRRSMFNMLQGVLSDPPPPPPFPSIPHASSSSGAASVSGGAGGQQSRRQVVVSSPPLFPSSSRFPVMSPIQELSPSAGASGSGGVGGQQSGSQGQASAGSARRVIIPGASGSTTNQSTIRQLQHQSLQNPANNSSNAVWGDLLAEPEGDTSAPNISPTLASLIVKSAEETLPPDRYKRRISLLKKPRNCQLAVARMPPNIWDGLPRGTRLKDCVLQEITKDLISGISGIAAAVGTQNQPLDARLFGVGVQVLSGIKVKLDNFRKASLTGNMFSSSWKFLNNPSSPKTGANDGTFTDLGTTAPLVMGGGAVSLVSNVIGGRPGLAIRTNNAPRMQTQRYRPYRRPTPGRVLSSSRNDVHSRSRSPNDTHTINSSDTETD